VQQNLYTGWPLSGRGQGHVTDFVILHHLNSVLADDRPFRFYTELTMEEHNKIYTQDSP